MAASDDNPVMEVHHLLAMPGGPQDEAAVWTLTQFLDSLFNDGAGCRTSFLLLSYTDVDPMQGRVNLLGNDNVGQHTVALLRSLAGIIERRLEDGSLTPHGPRLDS